MLGWVCFVVVEKVAFPFAVVGEPVYPVAAVEEKVYPVAAVAAPAEGDVFFVSPLFQGFLNLSDQPRRQIPAQLLLAFGWSPRRLRVPAELYPANFVA